MRLREDRPIREDRPVVVGIARGGVPVAAEVAVALDAPLDVALVRKISAPASPEFAIGALAEGGVRVIGEAAVQALHLSEADLYALLGAAEGELTERLRQYRGSAGPADVKGRNVILVDDGLATGRSARAATRALRLRGAAHVTLAVPVAAPESASALGEEVDALVCVEAPSRFWAVGCWYKDFRAISDAQVISLLAAAAQGAPTTSESIS